MTPLPYFAPAALLFLLASHSSAAEAPASAIVQIGEASYTTARPPDCKALPGQIYRIAALKGPTPTGQWWSSLVWQPLSNNLFPHPLAMRCTEDGLAITYPGAAIVANAAAIMGGGVDEGGDLRIGHSSGARFPTALCGGHSDWFVTASFSAGDASLNATFGHGSPFVFCTFAGGDPTLTFPTPPTIWAGTAEDPVLGVTSRGNHYGLFGATGSSWEGLDGKVFTNRGRGKTYFAVALLPDNSPETLALFQRFAHNHVVDTKVTYEIEGDTVTSTYSFLTHPHEGGEQGTLFALYPHQWKYTTSELSPLSYASVRGEMKLAQGTSFTTQIPVHGVLPMLPAEGITDRARLLAYLEAEAAKDPPPFADTYWEGKYLGRLTTLSGVAEAAGATATRDTFIAEIARRLEAWFTATPDGKAPIFFYDANWGTLIGSKPSYGSDEKLNDHHFHYGYFIRAAAELARVDPAWARRWKPMVDLLIRDIASFDLNDPMFPRLRCFDSYAGHSWASGDANFADGNNQESSSEAMNAWYGMMLWGAATGDIATRDAGIFLFNTERTAIEEYWFDVSDTNFPPDFPQVALGMVWGGKGAFATWFSGDIDCIHGINWLPFTPASLYMGRHPDYVKKNHDQIVAVRPGGTDYNTGWGDLVVLFNALADPAAAAAFFDANPDCKLEGGNTHAFMHHWISTLHTLGTPDTSVTSNHAFATVLSKGGTKTYLAYHFGEDPVQISFSDGVSFLAQPGRVTSHSRD